MNYPTIGIVVPNRNDANYLKRCLDSIVFQTVLPDQIVVVDDNSTDDSMEVISSKLATITGAKIIRNSSCIGTMGALNVGLEHADTDYVLFLSSNDFVEPHIVERAKACIVNSGSPGVWSALVSVVNENDERIRVYPTPIIALKDIYLPPDECIYLANKLGHWFTGTTLMYHRDTLRQIGGFDTDYLGLGDLMAALTVASIKGAAFSPEPLAVIRPHPGGLMWRTLTDLPQLDAILVKIEHDGQNHSPRLFTPKFCQLITRRIRFTAIRTMDDGRWVGHLQFWQGSRYRMLNKLSPLLGNHRSLQLIMSFLLLRPLGDLFAIVWYRFVGALYVAARQWVRTIRQK